MSQPGQASGAGWRPSLSEEEADALRAALGQAQAQGAWASELLSLELSAPCALRWAAWADAMRQPASQAASGDEPAPAASLCGALVAWLVGDELTIMHVATAPAWRRQGVGRALMQAGIERARQVGASSVWLEVRVSNAPARAMYEALGFVNRGQRRAYYADGEDALVMSLALT